jgi:6-phosphogluconolactonase (cycloisomerase 2 family)
MRIRSLGSLAKALSVAALSLILAGCGANSTNGQSGAACSGCFLVSATTNASQILTFKADSSGALGTPAITQGAANSPYLTAPLGGYAVYVSDPDSNAIDAFAVNSSDDTLSAITGSPFSLGTGPGSPAGLLSFGNYLYVGDTNGTIAALDNLNATGALTALPGSPFAAGFAPVNLISTYNNSDSIPLLYAADFTGGGIWGFTINSDGSLTPVPGSPFATAPNSAPAAMAVTGSGITGGILYVTLSGLNEIAAFSIGESGALAPLPGSPFRAGRGPASLLAYNNFLYALNGLDHTVSAYSVDANTGILTQIQGSPFPAGTASGGLISGNGGILYAPDSHSNSILAFSVDLPAGTLAPLPGSPFPTSVGPVALATVRFPILTP